MDNRIVFHFNKKFNQDPNVPAWVVKHKGLTYYVDHFESEVGFSTKETPGNEHTKGSLLLRGEFFMEIDPVTKKTTALIKESILKESKWSFRKIGIK